jgi:hypothetical protein
LPTFRRSLSKKISIQWPLLRKERYFKKDCIRDSSENTRRCYRSTAGSTSGIATDSPTVAAHFMQQRECPNYFIYEIAVIDFLIFNTTILLVGVLLLSATLLMGTNTLVSGK